MCHCTPNVRTPFCGKPGCEWPKPEGIREPDLNHHEQVALIVEHMKGMTQTECPVTHRFAPGVYLREIFMPADTVVIGKIHKTEHFNIILSGACLLVHEDGRREELRAPCTFISKAGVQKVLYIIEDTVWQTVHVTPETDLARLEAELITPVHPLVSDGVHAEIVRISQERLSQ
jgi:hypothetical protein